MIEIKYTQSTNIIEINYNISKDFRIEIVSYNKSLWIQEKTSDLKQEALISFQEALSDNFKLL